MHAEDSLCPWCHGPFHLHAGPHAGVAGEQSLLAKRMALRRCVEAVVDGQLDGSAPWHRLNELGLVHGLFGLHALQKLDGASLQTIFERRMGTQKGHCDCDHMLSRMRSRSSRGRSKTITRAIRT